MKTVKKNQLKKNVVDSSKNILKKTLYAGSVVAAASTAAINSANAVAIGNGATQAAANATAYNFSIATTDLIVRSNVSGNVYTVTVGAISDASVNTADIRILTQANDTAAFTATLSTVLIDGGTAGVMQITDIDTAVGNMDVTFAGAVDFAGALLVSTTEDANAGAGEDLLTTTFAAAVTIDGATVIDANDADVTGFINVNVNAAGTFTGGIDIGGGTDATDGTATITFGGSGAQAIAGVIDALGADNTGILKVTNTAGLVTFGNNVGTTNDLRNITIGGSAFDSDAKFSGEARAQTITVIGGDAADGSEDSTVEFAAASFGAVVLTPGTISTNTAKITFSNSGAIIALTGGITTGSTTGLNTEVHIIDSADAAGALQTITGAVGTSTNKIGLLNIGSATKAGLANFDEVVSVSQLTITGGNASGEISTGSFDKGLTATAVTLDDTGAILATLEMSATSAAILAGTIDGAQANNGTLKITGATKTINGVVGGTNALLNIDIDEEAIFSNNVSALGMNIAASQVAIFKGDITAGSSKLISIGTLSMGGSAAQTVTGLVQGNGTAGALTVSNAAGATFVNEIGGLVNSNLEMQTITTTGTGRIALTLDNNISNEVILGDGTFLDIKKTIVAGEKIFITTTAQDNASIDPGANIIMPVNMVAGTSITLVDGMTTGHAVAMVADANGALSDNAVMDYVASFGDTDQINIKANHKTDKITASELVVTTNEARAIKQLHAATVGTAADEDKVHNVLTAQGGNGATADTLLAQQAAPQTDTLSGSTAVTKVTTGMVQGIVSNRMASLRSGDAYIAGMSAGNGMSAKSGFIQAFASNAEQSNTKEGTATVYGYDTETAGVALGVDGLTDNGATVGIAASISTTEVDGKGTGKSNNDVDSYTVSLYADKATDNGYIEGSLTYGVNDNSVRRIVNTGGFNRVYTADFNSNQLSLKLSAGSPNEVGDGTFVTPYGSFSGTLISTDTYTEKSTKASDNL